MSGRILARRSTLAPLMQIVWQFLTDTPLTIESPTISCVMESSAGGGGEVGETGLIEGGIKVEVCWVGVVELVEVWVEAEGGVEVGGAG